MTKLSPLRQPVAPASPAPITPPTPPVPPTAPAIPKKPALDFKPMIKDAVKDHKSNRGGLSSASIAIIQSIYLQDAQQQGAQLQNNQNIGLNPGWGGQGR
jgi:hypothetical protein